MIETLAETESLILGVAAPTISNVALEDAAGAEVGGAETGVDTGVVLTGVVTGVDVGLVGATGVVGVVETALAGGAPIPNQV